MQWVQVVAARTAQVSPGPGRHGRRRGPTRRGRGLLAALVVVLLVAGTVAAVVLPGRTDGKATARPTSASPGSGGVADPLPAALVPLGLSGPTPPGPTPAGVAASLTSVLAAPVLGAPDAVVLDVATGQVLLGPGTAPATPASTTKLLTAAAALSTLGPEARLTTTAVAGATPTTVVLVGAGDPSLAGPTAPLTYPQPARLADLAAGIARSGVAAIDSVVVDASLFSGPQLGPGWKPSYVTDGDVAPVSALMIDYGRVRPDKPKKVADPALAAGQALLGLLPQYGVQVPATARVTTGLAPPGARRLAAVSSPPLADLVELMLRTSSNELAEALARLVAVQGGQPGSFQAGAAAVRGAAGQLGLSTSGVVLVDGSGLSPADQVPPLVLAQLLRLAAGPGHPDLRSIVTGLPVAGFAGTLIHRYLKGPTAIAAGAVRAKTGTLTGVSALAGLVLDTDGRLLAFDVAADRVPGNQIRAAEAALDAVAAALVACGCR